MMFIRQTLCLAAIAPFVCSLRGHNSALHGPSFYDEMVYDEEMRCARVVRRRLVPDDHSQCKHCKAPRTDKRAEEGCLSLDHNGKKHEWVTFASDSYFKERKPVELNVLKKPAPWDTHKQIVFANGVSFNFTCQPNICKNVDNDNVKCDYERDHAIQCAHCYGTGYVGKDLTTKRKPYSGECSKCKLDGEWYNKNGNCSKCGAQWTDEDKCKPCDGKGEDPCPKCQGTCWVNHPSAVDHNKSCYTGILLSPTISKRTPIGEVEDGKAKIYSEPIGGDEALTRLRALKAPKSS